MPEIKTTITPVETITNKKEQYNEKEINLYNTITPRLNCQTK